MKFFRRNALIIEYPSLSRYPSGCPTVAREKWSVAWAKIGFEKVKFIHKGMTLDKDGKKSRHNLILIDLDCTRNQFIDAISRYFSKKLNVNVHALKFRFERFQPFGDLNVL